MGEQGDDGRRAEGEQQPPAYRLHATPRSSPASSSPPMPPGGWPRGWTVPDGEGASPPPPGGGTGGWGGPTGPPPGWSAGGAGAPPPGWGVPQQGPRGQADNATTALVLGIVSIFFCGLFTGIPAMVLGARARRQVAASNGQLDGDSTAMAGIITGAVGTALQLMGLVFVVGIVMLGASVSDSVVDSDPVDGVCNEQRWLQDPDCGAIGGSGSSGGGIGAEGGINTDPPDGSCNGERWMQDPDCG